MKQITNKQTNKMKIDGTKFKEAKVGQELYWQQDCEYGQAGEVFYPTEDMLPFSGLMLGNGFLGENKITNTMKPHGQHIVVLDRGFVYVGDVLINGDYVTIKNAQCIRVWGTTNGLSQLQNGPLSSTKLDDKCEVIATMKSVIHFIKCQGF